MKNVKGDPGEFLVKIRLIVPQISQKCVAFIPGQIGEVQLSGLGAGFQPLQTISNFPHLGFTDYEDVFFAFLVTDTSANDLETSDLDCLRVDYTLARLIYEDG